MTAQVTKVFDDALKLGDNERAELAARLIDSLDSDREQDVEEAWAAEIEKRLEELDQDTATTIPWSEVRQRIMGNGDESANR